MTRPGFVLDDERTPAARQARESGEVPSAPDLAELVDWSPERVWSPRSPARGAD